MALTAFQVEQAGSGKPKALGPGKHHDDHGLYLEVRNATSKSWTGRDIARRRLSVRDDFSSPRLSHRPAVAMHRRSSVDLHGREPRRRLAT